MFTKIFKQLAKNDVALAGGKGASLGEMTQAGIPVPSGFVVLASSFDRFLEETDLGVEVQAQLSKVNYQDMYSVDQASKIINDLIVSSEMPKDIADEIMQEFEKLDVEFVAVRSSATAEDSSAASWAGELESFLNTDKKTLLSNVKQCWASLFTPRAIFYRHEKKLLETKVSVAVVVQAMIQSEVSGICFTVHPVTKDHNQMIIEAGYGLGEAIVGGMVTPDSYVIDKADKNILDINVNNQDTMIVQSGSGNETVEVPVDRRSQQKLNSGQIINLAEICLNIEEHYGFPCDIEWAYKKEKFYIVQSRPITTL